MVGTKVRGTTINHIAERAYLGTKVRSLVEDEVIQQCNKKENQIVKKEIKQKIKQE